VSKYTKRTLKKPCGACSCAYATMGWLRLVGSLKLYDSFAKEAYKREDLLQKRDMILRSLLLVATPYRVAKLHRGPSVAGFFVQKSNEL